MIVSVEEPYTDAFRASAIKNIFASLDLYASSVACPYAYSFLSYKIYVL